MSLFDLPAWQNMDPDEQASFLEWNRCLPSGPGIRWASSVEDLLGIPAKSSQSKVADSNVKCEPWTLLTMSRIRECCTDQSQSRCAQLKEGAELQLSYHFDERSHYSKVAVSSADAGGRIGFLSFERGDPILAAVRAATGYDASASTDRWLQNHYRAIVSRVTGGEPPDRPLRGVNIRLEQRNETVKS
jgi:hypothetical protein